MKDDQFFGPYKILDKLAGGAFSEIFRVMKENKEYALKKLHNYLKFDYEYTALLKTEALLLKQITDKSHFPEIYESGEINQETYLILELIEGLSLEEAIEKSFYANQHLSPTWACQITLEICKGLENLHSLNLFPDKPTVHGDLRASNVMVSNKGEIKLIDLGLKGGTFDYMPLERLHDRIITPFTDIYAVGHLLYEMLHGKRLFKGKTKLEAYFEMREIKITEQLFEDRIPSEIKRILVKCLNQESNAHYQTVKELKTDLEEILNQAAIASPEIFGDWIKSLSSGESE